MESIVKEILKDDRIKSKIKGTETLYKLTSIILKEFNFLDSNHPVEIKTIGSSLLSISQSIEKLRSEKTYFHGKTEEDYLITDSLYTYLVVNAVTTVGLFLQSYFKIKLPRPSEEVEEEHDDLPF
ncbi:abortive infection family protein [Galbibacter sp. PAP.153]|uniref:abortive infection family protein n=1 Tax=Galbibacter sp. PAP.153 TaxID=3104623 RepID=UPI003009A41E